jgi:hypothetical protein
MPQEPIPRTGTDPLVVEDHLLATLRDPAAMIGPRYARGLCSTVLLVAHTRKTTNEFFVDLLNNVAMIHGVLSKLEGAGQMLELLHTTDPEREPTTLNAEIEKLAGEWVVQRGLLADKLAAMMECPTGADAIN